MSTDVALDDFLDRSAEERRADPDQLSTILADSREDSVSSSPQPSQTGRTELVSLAQYILNEDPDLQEELEQTYADVDLNCEIDGEEAMEDIMDETPFQRSPLAYYRTHELSDLKCPDFRETPEQYTKVWNWTLAKLHPIFSRTSVPTT